jgi:hypothetical protein
MSSGNEKGTLVRLHISHPLKIGVRFQAFIKELEEKVSSIEGLRLVTPTKGVESERYRKHQLTGLSDPTKKSVRYTDVLIVILGERRLSPGYYAQLGFDLASMPAETKLLVYPRGKRRRPHRLRLGYPKLGFATSAYPQPIGKGRLADAIVGYLKEAVEIASIPY